jgi:hypothetical protein
VFTEQLLTTDPIPFVLIFLNTRSAVKTMIVMLAVPFRGAISEMAVRMKIVQKDWIWSNMSAGLM